MLRKVVVMLVIVIVLFVLFAWYEANKRSKEIECLYIPVEVTNPYCLEIR